MATDADLIAAGIILPIGSDYISEGDDAISANARILWDRIEGARVYRGSATLDSDYQTMAFGVYFVPSTTVAESLGLPVLRQGWLDIKVQGRVRRVDFLTNDVNDDNPLQTWQIATDHNGEWGRAEWILATVPQAVRELGDLTGAEDLDTIEDGSAWIRNGSVSSQLGLPLSGELQIGRVGRITTASPVGASYPRIQTWQTDDVNAGYSLEQWERSTSSTGAWRPWQQVYPAPAAGGASERHSILQGDQYNAVGGAVNTAGATPVALTWDDFPADTRDLVVPMLRERGIQATLALPSEVLSPERAPALGGEGITWPEIDALAAEGVLEIANHSATHLDASADGLEAEIVTSLEDLQTNLPSADIYCWIQPSVDYPDFNNGNSLDAWTQTEAGQLILEYHAYATGVWNRRSDASVDRNGSPVQGVGRSWIDTASGLSTVQARIASLAGTGRGLIVGAHANRLTLGDTYTTPAQLEAFLDWLIAEQDAGRVRLLTLSQWAWSDARPAPADPPSEWQATVPLTDDWRTDVDSSVTAYRTGNVVTVAAWRLATKAGVNGDVVAYTLPTGYRPPALFVDRTLDSRDATVKLGSNNVVTVSTALNSHLVSHHSFTFVTGDPTPPASDAVTWDGFEDYQNLTDDQEEES